MTSTYYVIIEGRLPGAVAELLDQRFDDVRVCAWTAAEPAGVPTPG